MAESDDDLLLLDAHGIATNPQADVVAPFLGELPQRLLGLVEVPVWEVARVHERVPGPQEVDRGQQLVEVVRRLERLGREAHVLPDVLGRTPLAPRDLAPAGAPVR